MSDPAAQITIQLTTKGLTPNLTWLSAFLATQRPTTPLQALTQTASFRLLASDIATSLAPSPQTCFPPDVHDANIKERRLPAGPVPVQILAIEDMSKSRWEQIEVIEALERGEGTKGREIIRVTATEEDDIASNNVPKGGGPHKLLLQDTAGRRVYGIELKAIEGVGLGMNIGSKMVLKNTVVARGAVLLEPATVTVLGGKIDSLHKAWKDGRKAELKAAIEMSEQAAR